MQFLLIWALLFFSIRFVTIGLTLAAHKFFNRHKWKARKINIADTPWEEELKKVKSGLLIGSVFRTGLLAALFSLPQEWVPFYYSIGEHGWLYFFATILAYTVYFDLWFYISHRFIFHQPSMYKKSHLTHHRFKDPMIPVRNAFSSSEILITAFGGYALVLVMPFHPAALLIGRELIVQLINIYNHLGYEIMPRGFTKHFLFRYFTTPTHHTLHHMYNNCNYSLLLNYDVVFGTQFKKYDQTFEAIHSRIEFAEDELKNEEHKQVS